MKRMQEMLIPFIEQHRTEFDAAAVPQKVWQRIESCLDSKDELEHFVARHRYLFDAAPFSSSQKLPPDTPDSLEEYIRQHREQFDMELPAASVWERWDLPSEKVGENSDTDVPTRQHQPLRVGWVRVVVRVAAAAAVMLLCFWAGLKRGAAPSTTHSGMSLSQISDEYAELEGYFQRDIAAKQSQLARFAQHHQQQIRADLDQLDEIMQELRVELAQVPSGNREQVVRAMIENYRAKSAILEKVLWHIQRQENQQKTSEDNATQSI